MKVYVTRHGQPAIGDLPSGVDHEFPPGDPVLTSLGIMQAASLGKYLKSRSFKGKIYCSPYRRTLFTAQEVAMLTGAKIYPEKTIQEYVLQEGKPDIKTLNLPEIKKTFPYIAAEATLDESWLFSGPETGEDVRRRIKPFIDDLLNSNEEEVLLVGHGASVGACKTLLFEAGEIPYTEKYNWNCSLSEFTVENGKTIAVELNCDISFIPEEWVTSNLLKYDELEDTK